MNPCLLAPEAVPAFLEKLRRRQAAAKIWIKEARENLSKTAHTFEPERLLSILEDIQRHETRHAMFTALLPNAGTPDPSPEMLAARFITLSLVKCDATWSGTGNGLRIISHANRLDVLQEIRYDIFPA